jgi:parvulin-like peptidyl-prolyl isomerase
MSEWIRASRGAKWVGLVGVCGVAFAMGRMVSASPLQQNKSAASKPAADKKKSDPASTSSDTPVVAVVNGEEITFKALAEEAIARKGSEILETMISRLLVEQACRQQGIKISAQEINEEIARTSARLNMTPEQYFKLLKDQKNITAAQYERDIVIPGLALKKMARQGVKVTNDDIEKGFEAYYGEKMRCRWIMLNDQPTAMKVWNELKAADKKNEGKIDVAEFERQVTRWSVDPGSRSLGGQLQPIARHTSPAFKSIEDAAFAMKSNGEISKVVQFGEAYVILYREDSLPPAQVKLEDVRDKIEADIYEAKMRDQIEQIFLSIQRKANIKNLLTGEVSSASDKEAVPAEHIEKNEPAKPTTKMETPKKTNTPTKK